MSSEQFFKNLETFLPQHVSPFPSYAHAFLAMLISGLVAYRLGAKYFAGDPDQNGQVSDTEARAKRYVHIAASAVTSLLVADSAFTLSFMVRSFKLNKKHFVYKRWFPILYSAVQ